MFYYTISLLIAWQFNNIYFKLIKANLIDLNNLSLFKIFDVFKQLDF